MKKSKRIFAAAILVFVTALVLSQSFPVNAQSRSVTVLRRDGDITILSNGDVRFEETWEVQFFGGPFRFAFRSIPLNKATGITDWGVSEGNQIYQESISNEPLTYELTREGNEIKIQWYFPPTSDDTRTFRLSYMVQGSLGIYDSGDRFFWKFVESDRGYTIASSNVRVHLPGNFSADQLEMASFVNGQEVSTGQIVDGQTVAFSNSSLASGEEWEIGVIFPHGVVSAQPEAWQLQEDRAPIYRLATVCFSVIILLGGILLLYLLWYIYGRDKPMGVELEYIPRPPEDVPPAVAGTLVDEHADMEDVIATLVDLARRGYLRIVEKEKSGIGSKGEFQFIREKKSKSGMLPYEEELFSAVFKTRDVRNLSSLRNKFYTSLPKIKDKLYDEVVKQGYFRTSPEKVRGRYLGLGCGIFALLGGISFFIYTALSSYTDLVICAALSIMVFPVGFLILGRFMPRKTQKGAHYAGRWRAFKRYLEDIEKYAQLDEAQEQFEKYLPYAIAFGIEKDWVKKFAQIETPIPTWYEMYPVGPIGPRRTTGRGVLGSPVASGSGKSKGGGVPSLDQAAGRAFSGLEAMSTGFFTMLNSATDVMVSAPSSSGSGGGFSGGGFSGGGGGGGGSSGFG